MIYAKTRKENFIGYLIFEILMVGAVTLVVVGLLVFYGTARNSDPKVNTWGYLVDNPALLAVICLFPVVLSVAAVLIFRNRKYITGFALDESKGTIELEYRGLSARTLKAVSWPLTAIKVSVFEEKKFMFVQPYHGFTITCRGKIEKLDFILNNYIWEEQHRERMYIREELEKLQS